MGSDVKPGGKESPQSKPRMSAYRPSNGTEGIMFMEQWCWTCKRDAKYRETQAGEDGCPILAATFAHAVDEPGYPRDIWIEDASGPRCLSYERDLTIVED